MQKSKIRRKKKKKVETSGFYCSRVRKKYLVQNTVKKYKIKNNTRVPRSSRCLSRAIRPRESVLPPPSVHTSRLPPTAHPVGRPSIRFCFPLLSRYATHIDRGHRESPNDYYRR